MSEQQQCQVGVWSSRHSWRRSQCERKATTTREVKMHRPPKGQKRRITIPVCTQHSKLGYIHPITPRAVEDYYQNLDHTRRTRQRIEKLQHEIAQEEARIEDSERRMRNALAEIDLLPWCNETDMPGGEASEQPESV